MSVDQTPFYDARMGQGFLELAINLDVRHS